MPGALDLHGVGHWFDGGRVVFRGVVLHAEPGDIIAVRGDNGSGKTTLLRLCAGVARPREGAVDRRGSVGYLPHTGEGEVPRIAAGRWADLMAGIRGQSPEGNRERLEHLGLRPAELETPLAGLSRGNLTKVMFAVAAGCRPDLLILDEPFAALDDDGRKAVLLIVREAAEAGAIVLISDHERMRETLPNRVLQIADELVREEQAPQAAPDTSRWVIVFRDAASAEYRVDVTGSERDRAIRQALSRGEEVLRVEEVR